MAPSVLSRLRGRVDRRTVLVIATVLVVAWAVVRAVSAWPLITRYGGNIWVFLALDVATALPYPWCLDRMVTALLRGRRTVVIAAWGLLVAALFAGPYAYLWVVCGEAMPPWLQICFAAFLVVLALLGPVRAVASRWSGRASATDDGGGEGRRQRDADIVA